MLETFQNTVAVSEADLIHLSAMLDYRRDISARMAEVAIKHQNFGNYLSLRDSFNDANELLSLSMFDGYRDECRKEFPKYVDESRAEAMQMFEDMTIDYVFSDGSLIDDTVDVPF